jgi:hypothetical protein
MILYHIYSIQRSVLLQRRCRLQWIDEQICHTWKHLKDTYTTALRDSRRIHDKLKPYLVQCGVCWDCFTYQNSADGSFRLEGRRLSRALIRRLEDEHDVFQWDITNTSVWSDVVFTKENVINMTNPFDIACLQEAYFAIQTVDVLLHRTARGTWNTAPCDHHRICPKPWSSSDTKHSRDVCRAYDYDTLAGTNRVYTLWIFAWWDEA